jgi:hypothetical protein
MISNWLAIIRDIVVILIGIAGLAFGFYRYWKGREAEAILQIELILEVFPLTSNNVVSIGIQIKNVGKTAAYVPPEQVKEAICSVRKISCPNCHLRLNWEQLEQLKLIEGLEYLSDKDWDLLDPEEPFIFEPGAMEVYRVFFATDYHGLVWVRAVLVDKMEYTWRADQFFVLP